MKKNTTKQSLLASVLALAMCVTMLVGTTFAWFTDSASTAVNKIESGTLHVDIVDESGNSLDGKTLSFRDVNKNADILWEPGATFALDSFRIVNTGKLALKYEVIINGVTGDAKLLEAIDFTVKLGSAEVALDGLSGAILPAGAEVKDADKEVVEKTDLITITGTMRTDAGNEYQGLTLAGLGITVVATQYTYENDSRNNRYDADAEATIQVNKDNIQDYLDGKYGSIDGMTLVLAAGDYGQLELGRATKYAGSHTQYRIGSYDAEPMTFEDFSATINDGQYHPLPRYIRSMSNVTFRAADGAVVTVAGVKMTSGHQYGNSQAPVTDYVLDWTITDNGGYFLAQKVSNITFEGIKFTAKSTIETSEPETVISGFSFKDCAFDLGYTGAIHNDDYVAIRYYSEIYNGKVTDLVVDKCKFENCSQGVYTQKIINVTVTGCSFQTITHNAIAVQDGINSSDHGKVNLIGNTFDTIGADAIRFDKPGANTQITIKNNTATNIASGRYGIRATTLASGITYDISGNNWGEGKTVANPEFADRT